MVAKQRLETIYLANIQKISYLTKSKPSLNVWECYNFRFISFIYVFILGAVSESLTHSLMSLSHSITYCCRWVTQSLIAVSESLTHSLLSLSHSLTHCCLWVSHPLLSLSHSLTHSCLWVTQPLLSLSHSFTHSLLYLSHSLTHCSTLSHSLTHCCHSLSKFL